MTKLKIKDALYEHDFSSKKLADELGITQQAVSIMLKKDSITTKSLFAIADALQCRVSDLIEDDRAQEQDQRCEDVCAMIRYRGIHYTADTLDELYKIVDEIRTIADTRD